MNTDEKTCEKQKRLRVAAYGLIVQNGQLLLCRLSNKVPKWEGYWTLPGGGLNFGESPEDAVIREIFEETGLQVKVVGISGIDNLYVQRDFEDFHGIRIIFCTEIVSGHLKFEKNGTTDYCEFHPFGNISNLKKVELVDTALELISN